MTRRDRMTRNTTTHHICAVCDGAGETYHNDSHGYGFGPDPQDEYTMPCNNLDCEDGWVRFAPIDPLEVLRGARRRRYLIPRGAMYYGEMRQRAVSPVELP